MWIIRSVVDLACARFLQYPGLTGDKSNISWFFYFFFFNKEKLRKFSRLFPQSMSYETLIFRQSLFFHDLDLIFLTILAYLYKILVLIHNFNLTNFFTHIDSNLRFFVSMLRGRVTSNHFLHDQKLGILYDASELTKFATVTTHFTIKRPITRVCVRVFEQRSCYLLFATCYCYFLRIFVFSFVCI